METHKITWMSVRRLNCACGTRIHIEAATARKLTQTQAQDVLLDTFQKHKDGKTKPSPKEKS